MYLRPLYPRIRQSPKNRQNEFMSFLHASFYRLFLDASALVGSPNEVAVSHEGCQEGIGTDRWHPLGPVLYIAVIARDVPAEDARPQSRLSPIRALTSQP